MKRLARLALALCLQCARPAAPADAGAVTASARLTFARDGRPVRSFSLAELTELSPPVTVSGFDPYYQRAKRFRAMPLEALLVAAFSPATVVELARMQFVLRAQDGYTVPLSGQRLLEGGAHLAIADLDVAAWEPIGPRRANPGPFYLVWSNPAQGDLETHPRPWQLATIEIAAFETVFPHTAPVGEPDGAPAWRGYALFREQCVRCHAVNREGGRVGPDLNVPRSIVEYRPAEQIRSYIRNPLRFRYSVMPAHPGLTDGDLDGLLAYFQRMSALKFDPEARAADAGARP